MVEAFVVSSSSATRVSFGAAQKTMIAVTSTIAEPVSMMTRGPAPMAMSAVHTRETRKASRPRPNSKKPKAAPWCSSLVEVRTALKLAGLKSTSLSSSMRKKQASSTPKDRFGEKTEMNREITPTPSVVSTMMVRTWKRSPIHPSRIVPRMMTRPCME